MENEFIRIIIVDDYEMVLTGLETNINKMQGMEVVGTALNGQEAIQLADSVEYDLILMDIVMPEMDGIEATKEILKKHPDKIISAFTSYDDVDNICDMIEAGVKGYILKKTNRIELESAIRKLIYEGEYFSKDLYEIMREEAKNIDKFSNRQLQVLQLLANGFTIKCICLMLGIDEGTVKTYRAELADITGAKNIDDLIFYAIENKLVKDFNALSHQKNRPEEKDYFKKYNTRILKTNHKEKVCIAWDKIRKWFKR